jgi:hypothetical protein
MLWSSFFHYLLAIIDGNQKQKLMTTLATIIKMKNTKLSLKLRERKEDKESCKTSEKTSKQKEKSNGTGNSVYLQMTQ